MLAERLIAGLTRAVDVHEADSSREVERQLLISFEHAYVIERRIDSDKFSRNIVLSSKAMQYRDQ